MFCTVETYEMKDDGYHVHGSRFVDVGLSLEVEQSKLLGKNSRTEDRRKPGSMLNMRGHGIILDC